MLHKATSLIDGLLVHPERMLENIQATRGLVFSGQLLLALTQKGGGAGDRLRVGAAKRDEGLGREEKLSRAVGQ